MNPIIADRLSELDALKLDKGSHSSFEDGHCATELVAYLAGEEHSDEPDCLSPILGAMLRRFNDNADDELRQRLKPYLPKCIGTANDGKEELRGYVVSDWSIRVALPMWMELPGATEVAEKLRALPPLSAENADVARREARS
nr:hypothetical protein [Rubrobacteraceae bacterium]